MFVRIIGSLIFATWLMSGCLSNPPQEDSQGLDIGIRVQVCATTALRRHALPLVTDNVSATPLLAI